MQASHRIPAPSSVLPYLGGHDLLVVEQVDVCSAVGVKSIKIKRKLIERLRTPSVHSTRPDARTLAAGPHAGLEALEVDGAGVHGHARFVLQLEHRRLPRLERPNKLAHLCERVCVMECIV